MITEDYVSFETSKLLKEKGFGGECFSMYLTPKPHSGMGNPNEAKIAPHGRDSHYYEGYRYQCEAPTLQMAMKWLEEKYGIFCVIRRHGNSDNGFTYSWNCEGKMGLSVGNDGGFKTAVEACEFFIEYCLKNLI